MTITEVLAKIEAEAETARANARENDPMSVSGAYDSGRCAGLYEAASIIAELMEVAR